MNTKEQYVSASFLMGGAACAILLTSTILNRIGGTGTPVIPGFSYLAGLSWCLLFFWVGIILRGRWPKTRTWIQVLLFCAVIFLIYRYRHIAWITWETIPYIYLACIGLGFLSPPALLLHNRRQKGWMDFILTMISIFCYVSVAVARDRVSHDVFLLENEDMHHLLQWLLSNVEPLLLIVSLYFISSFSFSKAGLWIGKQRWFRLLSGVVCAIVFILCLGGLVSFGLWGYGLVFLMRFMVLPGTVYLVYVIVRSIKRRRTGGTWKEVFML